MTLHLGGFLTKLEFSGKYWEKKMRSKQSNVLTTSDLFLHKRVYDGFLY